MLTAQQEARLDALDVMAQRTARQEREYQQLLALSAAAQPGNEEPAPEKNNVAQPKSFWDDALKSDPTQQTSSFVRKESLTLEEMNKVEKTTFNPDGIRINVKGTPYLMAFHAPSNSRRSVYFSKGAVQLLMEKHNVDDVEELKGKYPSKSLLEISKCYNPDDNELFYLISRRGYGEGTGWED